MATPGPGYYVIGNSRRRNLKERKLLRVFCTLKFGIDICNGCGISFTTQDYYKYGNKNWCCNCFKKKSVDRIGKEFASKVRNCSFFHEHSVRGCTLHTTTPHQINSLTRLEKIMWIKYGDLF